MNIAKTAATVAAHGGTVAVIGHSRDVGKVMLERIAMHHQEQVKVHRRHAGGERIEYRSGGRVVLVTLQGLRGRTIDYLVLDDHALIEDPAAMNTIGSVFLGQRPRVAVWG